MTFIRRRNVIIALLMGPTLTFLSIALGVPDQGFDSLAGFGGFIVASAASAVLSAAAFLCAAVVGRLAISVSTKRLSEARSVLLARIVVALLLALAYYLFFRLPTVKLELFVMVAVSFFAALALRPVVRERGPIERSGRARVRRRASSL